MKINIIKVKSNILLKLKNKRRDLFMLKDFKEFALKGNIVELAVAVIIGGAFGKIVSSFVDDIIMPLLGLLLGGRDFTNYFITLDGSSYKTLAAARDAGIATLNYGQFLGYVLDFVIISFSIFLALRYLSKLKKKEEVVAEEVTSKQCDYCRTEIDILATRCPNCTSKLDL